MKSDLDSLMEAQNIDAILVTGAALHNPAMVYFTGLAHVTGGDLFKKRGEPAVLFHGPMERDEAAKTGLLTRSYSAYPYSEFLKAANNDRLMAMSLRYQKMLTDLGITRGSLALYGQIELGLGYAIFAGLQQIMPELKLVGYLPDDILSKAKFTKDEAEIERIRHMGVVTTRVVGNTADFLSSHAVKNGELVKSDGTPLTIGEVKSQIDLWLSEQGAENPEGTIFAIGSDAGVPHSTGKASDHLRLGETIVFDIFPCEAGGGYFYDFTRTWCLGYAPEPAQALYDQVFSVYNQIQAELKVNEPFSTYQKRTCELFEGMGHPTVGTQPATEVGYVHSLGHGVGLQVHERPACNNSGATSDLLAPGTVFTLEPGLYYPERSLGVRIEDTLWTRPDGTFEILADFPKDLILPVKK